MSMPTCIKLVVIPNDSSLPNQNVCSPPMFIFPGHMHLVSLCQSACKAREIYSFLPRVPTSKFILCFFVSLSQNWQRVSIITSFSPLLSSSSRPWICTPLTCHTQWESCLSKFTFRHCQNWLATPNHYINPPIFPFPPLLINFHPLHLISSYIILCILPQHHVAKQQQHHQDASSCHLLRSPSQGQWYLCRLWIALPYDKWVYYLLFELPLTSLTHLTFRALPCSSLMSNKRCNIVNGKAYPTYTHLFSIENLAFIHTRRDRSIHQKHQHPPHSFFL